MEPQPISRPPMLETVCLLGCWSKSRLKIVLTKCKSKPITNCVFIRNSVSGINMESLNSYIQIFLYSSCWYVFLMALMAEVSSGHAKVPSWWKYLPINVMYSPIARVRQTYRGHSRRTGDMKQYLMAGRLLSSPKKILYLLLLYTRDFVSIF